MGLGVWLSLGVWLGLTGMAVGVFDVTVEIANPDRSCG